MSSLFHHSLFTFKTNAMTVNFLITIFLDLTTDNAMLFHNFYTFFILHHTLVEDIRSVLVFDYELYLLYEQLTNVCKWKYACSPSGCKNALFLYFFIVLAVPEEAFKNESSLQPPHRQVIQKSTMIIRKRKRK